MTYYDLCAQWNYNCYDNEILRLSDVIPSIEVGDYNLTYPITFHPETFEVCILKLDDSVNSYEVLPTLNVKEKSRLICFIIFSNMCCRHSLEVKSWATMKQQLVTLKLFLCPIFLTSQKIGKFCWETRGKSNC